jgi:hypothetical protein
MMEQEPNQTRGQGNPETPEEQAGQLTAIPPAPDEPVLKQSGLGIASFIIGLLCITGLIISMLTMVSSLTDFITADGTALDQKQLENLIMENASLVIAVLLFIGSLGVGLIGLILGIIGCSLRNRRKVFAIIGTVLNGLVIVGFVGLILFGAAMQ